jgi:Zn-dependent peptidase ImmA (M78 family)
MTSNETAHSTIGNLRDLVPPRRLSPSETRQVIERQTTRLLKLAEVDGPPVPLFEVIRALPRVEVKQVPTLPSSGRAQWSRNRWLLLVDSDEAPVRQRFSLGHELAHVIFHPLSDVVFYPLRGRTAEQWEEQACEYFAACLLMPRMWVKRAWSGGMRGVPDLARLFDVSYVSMQYRLEQIGLVERERADKRSAA